MMMRRSAGLVSRVGRRAFAAEAGKPVLDMPTDAETATGLEKRELDALAKGESLFGDDTLYGAFGTPEKPVIVKSVFDTRITGCVGGEGSEHDLTWHVVSHGKPLVCLECGQVFQLEKIEDPLLANHHH